MAGLWALECSAISETKRLRIIPTRLIPFAARDVNPRPPMPGPKRTLCKSVDVVRATHQPGDSEKDGEREKKEKKKKKRDSGKDVSCVVDQVRDRKSVV